MKKIIQKRHFIKVGEYLYHDKLCMDTIPLQTSYYNS